MATVKDAVDLTIRTIERRARNYRDLVVIVVLIFLGCGLRALIQFSALPLLGWLSLLPVCGIFFTLDGFLVDCWRVRLLQMWADEELAIDAFLQSVASIRDLLPRTLGGMVGTLPALGKAELSPVMRRAIAQAGPF